jgi:Zn-dependent protease
MNIVFKIISFMIPLILSLTFHEYAHARVAYWLGDDTAARMGRMTLNPIPHIDLVGTILIPIIAAFAGGLPLIGWAKPVPVMPVRYTRRLSMHTGDIIVSIAGPVSNIILATVCIVILRLAFHPYSLWNCLYEVQPGNAASLVQNLLATMVVMNVGLGIFNLIPIPPLDGSHLLPRSFQPVLDRIMPYSYIILMAAIYFLSSWLLIPVKLVLKLLGLITGILV